MRLFLCEKPSQALDIAKVVGAPKRGDGCFNGDGVVVSWAIGHLLETAPPDAYGEQYKKWDLAQLPIIPVDWKLIVKASTATQFKTIKKLLGQASEVVISTDADREGEMIARELLDYCDFRGSVRRLWLSALDDASIRKALQTLKADQETRPKYFSALGRSRADWLIGMNLSRLFTLLGKQSGYDGVLSVGRVQTPTLKLVVDREREIRDFKPVSYWTISVRLECSTGAFFDAAWIAPSEYADDQGRCVSQTFAAQVRNLLQQSGKATVVSCTTERKKEQAPLLYELSELQKVCSARYGYGAQEVLDLAQALYEKHKATSYPRTDGCYLPSSMQGEVGEVFKAIVATDPAMASLVAGLDVQRRSRIWNDKKVAESSHHGIIPTTTAANLNAMSDKERAVYDLVRRRYLAQFAPDHEYDATVCLMDCAGQQLKASGRQIVVQGCKAVTSDKMEDTQVLPQLSRGQSCAIVQADLQTQQTKPPALYTEGTLIDAMKTIAKHVTDPRLKQKLKETTGIGTNATRAGTIQGLIDRGLLMKKKRALVASEAAHTLIDALPQAITNPGMTAVWEQALDAIEAGQLTLDDFVSKQAIWLAGIVQKYSGSRLDIKLPPSPECPLCRSPMKKRNGQKGAFWSCSRYPECKGTLDAGEKKKTVRKKKS